jgi:serine protease Do
MYDGRRYVAQIIGQDEDSDIAVIKVNASGLRPIEWGDTSLIRAGEFALTIGSSLGADHTVGFGIISAVSRKKPQVSREAFFGDLEYIQTYAQINPGNSGGPLINLKGEVIGITSFIELAPHSPGFAIPANYARKVVSSLIKDGIVKRPAVGLYIVNLNSNNLIGNSDNLDQNQSGVLVRDVLKGGPANQAGIEIGDLITKVNGQDIKLPQEFTHSIRTSPVGSVFNLEIQRGKQKINTNLKSAYLD